jgi:hypothetical protein
MILMTSNDDLTNSALIACIPPLFKALRVYFSHSNPGTWMLTISATFDTHLLLPAHIFVTLAYLVHIHIERCIPHSIIPSWIPDKVWHTPRAWACVITTRTSKQGECNCSGCNPVWPPTGHRLCDVTCMWCTADHIVIFIHGSNVKWTAGGDS